MPSVKGIGEDAWEELYCHYREISRAAGDKEPSKPAKRISNEVLGDPF